MIDAGGVARVVTAGDAVSDGDGAVIGRKFEVEDGVEFLRNGDGEELGGGGAMNDESEGAAGAVWRVVVGSRRS